MAGRFYAQADPYTNSWEEESVPLANGFTVTFQPRSFIFQTYDLLFMTVGLSARLPASSTRCWVPQRVNKGGLPVTPRVISFAVLEMVNVVTVERLKRYPQLCGETCADWSAYQHA